MLRNLKDLENYKIGATDGDIGHVKDFYFDDAAWVMRYLVVETGTWASSREVLISPISVRHPDWEQHTLAVTITREQVRGSPDIDTDKPVSRQNEEAVLGYYGYSYYWTGTGMWGDGPYPHALAPGYAGNGISRIERERQVEAQLRDERARHRNDDPHLRSCNAVSGYRIQARDGDIGHVAGFLVDDETWVIRHVVINTSNWWLGHKVLVAPAWISDVNWSNHSVTVDLTRESIKNAPSYDSTLAWSREQEADLYRHHGRNGYWPTQAQLDSAA